jgi:hypothetical protein
MGQVTIYIDDDTEKKMAMAAKSMHVSKSKWITELIKKEVANEWPQAVAELAGAWDAFPSLEEIRTGVSTSPRDSGKAGNPNRSLRSSDSGYRTGKPGHIGHPQYKRI